MFTPTWYELKVMVLIFAFSIFSKVIPKSTEKWYNFLNKLQNKLLSNYKESSWLNNAFKNLLVYFDEPQETSF